MKTNRKAAVLALGLAMLSPLAGAQLVVDSEWWKVDFESPTPKGVYLEDGSLNVLTNDESGAVTTQPYYTGVWSAMDGDESYVTNEFNASESGGTNYCLKLDTQGNDLTWAPTNENKAIQGVITLVDADLYLVGSDTAPDPSDFDESGDVQTAIFLKNEIDEDSGETTNSILCVYTWDSTLNGGNGGRVWRELEGRQKTATNDIPDNAWYRVQVLVDYESNPDAPEVEVYVDGVKLHARGNASATRFTASHYDIAAAAKCVQSVSFRGTGAIDNFVGKTRRESYPEAYFKVVSYLGTDEVPESAEAVDQGLWQKTLKPLRIGKESVSFEGLSWNVWDDDLGDYSYVLSRIEIDDFSTIPATTRTYRFEYDANDEDNPRPLRELDPDPDHIAVGLDYVAEFYYDEDKDEYTGEYVQSGYISVTNLPTTGATPPANENDAISIVRLYFEHPPRPGDFKLTAAQNFGDSPADQTFNKNDDLAATTTFEYREAFAENGTNFVLRTVAVTPGYGITAGYASHTATVTVPLEANKADYAAATPFSVATATYVVGDYTGTTPTWIDNGDGTYTLGNFVAKIGSTPYESLREAIDHAVAGDTVVMIADDRVSFTAEDTEIIINKALTIDGGSNTLYGVTGYAYDGVNDHDLFIAASAGDVTIKNLTFSEFSDTAPTVQYRTYPIWTSQAYAGKLTLDGVTVEKFARTAINLGNGTFEITNCVIKGYAGDAGAPARYFQNAITVVDAKGTVADTTATGIGSTADPWGAGLVTYNSNGAGEVTFLSGSYTADFIAEVSSNATGKLVIEGGTFVATAPAEDEGQPVSAFQFDDDDPALKVTISGGWFDREPEEGFITNGMAAVNYTNEAPNPLATWTVEVPTFKIDFYVDDAVYATTNVPAGTLAAGYAPADPTKASTAQFDYEFDYWTNAVGDAFMATTLPPVSTDTNYYAVFAETTRKYWISWVVDDTTTSNEVEYGTVPAYAGTPGKPSTETTVYEFAGWDHDPVAVVGEATYTAMWTETVRSYDVIWVVEGSDPTTNKVAYGETPAYPNGTPERESTVATNFTFAGWTPEIVAVTGEATYTATWTETLRKYWISWVVDGTTTSNEVDYGAVPSYGADPEKENYTFKGWATADGATEAKYGVGVALPEVGGAAKYYAVFEENAPEHIGAAASDNGFMILAPEDPTNVDDEAPVFTDAPAITGTTGTTKISAQFVKPDGVTTATVRILYKTSLAPNATVYSAPATVTNIDMAAGTADVSYDLSALAEIPDTFFLVGFADGEPAGNGD